MTDHPSALVSVPIEGQSFSSEQDWINRASRVLTAHPEYNNAEHGERKGWRGQHFTALCFDQAGNRMRNGGDFMRATKEQTYPVWWIWPDQIAAMLAAAPAAPQATREEAPAEAREALVRLRNDASRAMEYGATCATVRLDDLLSALRAQPQAREDAQPLGCFCDEADCPSCSSINPSPYAMRRAVEALECAVSWIEDLPRKNASHAMRDDKLDELRQALAALQAEQGAK